MNIKKNIGIWLAFVIAGTVVIALKLILFPTVQVPTQSSEQNVDPSRQPSRSVEEQKASQPATLPEDKSPLPSTTSSNQKREGFLAKQVFELATSGKHEQALQILAKEIELNPKNIEAYGTRAALYMGLAYYQEAINDSDKFIHLLPRDKKTSLEAAGIYAVRCEAYNGLKNYVEAITDCDKAIELDPNCSDAYFNRSVAFATAGNDQQGVKDLKAAARLGHKKAQVVLRTQNIQW